MEVLEDVGIATVTVLSVIGLIVLVAGISDCMSRR
jgi:uncharacterized membrane protein HdeD (DUF308 family)